MPKWPLSLAIVALPVALSAANYKYHDVTATFLSADQANKFSVKLDDGSTSTGMAEGDAVRALPSLKPGDRILITCKDDAQGRHLSATAIRVVK